jgi:heme-degrading monooxygenase HmoA
MRFLLFDVKPWPDAVGRYLEIAAALRPQLDQSGGCDHLDRYRRIGATGAEQGWLLSFQYWSDEAAITRWRENAVHHQAQTSGSDTVFEDYRLRVGEVLRNKTPSRPATQIAEPRGNTGASYVVIIESKSAAFDLNPLNPALRFESIYRPGSFLHVGNTAHYDEALHIFSHAETKSDVNHLAIGAVERDYGMFERAQAPKVFAPREG